MPSLPFDATSPANGKPPSLPYGGAYGWQLPTTAACASQARSALASAMTVLGYSHDVIDDGMLAVSELATNAYQHAARVGPYGAITTPELWMWARTRPQNELVVTVFDACRNALPQPNGRELLDEHGRGLGIIDALSSCWGWHPSRAWIGSPQTQGKASWFALPLPARWPMTARPIPPATAAERLLLVLRSRHVRCVRRSDDIGISLLTAGTLNIWVKPASFSWRLNGDDYASHPLIDVQEAAEHIVQTLEEAERPVPT
ncbi:ATP-binding protein [Actinomadura sp. 9N407]|uniref:ATP-binding protein n=1 Tax=Actinomadura sp. 9N407 TaxID=3375154 RepID=UPI00378B3F6E